MADPVLVVNLLESLEWSAKPSCHDLGMLRDAAVPTCVRMLRFEDEDVAPVNVPAASLTKNEWAVV